MLPYAESLVIIPTYNEIDNIEKMLQTVRGLYPELSILIIDDGSPDGTANKVKEKQKNDTKLFLIERSGKNGLGTAYIRGFKWGLEKGYQYFMEMDCDFSHNPQDIKNLLAAAQENDLAIGSRYINGIRIINWPFKRLILSMVGSLYVRIITGMPLLDTTGGFKCFSRRALESIRLDNCLSLGYSFQTELNYKVWSRGLRVIEVPIVFTERAHGVSKMSGSIIKEALWVILKLRWNKALGKL